MAAIDWNLALKPLLELYQGRRHPLAYRNAYQLLVMVILSAQDSDQHINAVAPALFAAFPNLRALARADEAALLQLLAGVRGARKKAAWLRAIAATLGHDRNIPDTLDGLTALPGIGRKSANVILRETGRPAEGIMVDLHVIRVAPRLGIATGTDPKKLEQQMMAVLERKLWSDAGMALSFLGRDTCRPKNPQHDDCVLRDVCAYCKQMGKQAGKQAGEQMGKQGSKGKSSASRATRPRKAQAGK